MSKYHLEVLNDKEFEELSKDLLEKELGVQFQIFKTGRDKGIDLRYACTKENEIIVQAKRFIRSTFPNLTTELNNEKLKMSKLFNKPDRYILITALDLSVDQVDKVVLQMKPFINNSQDVYPLERIINLISKYPDIEKKYYKLWLTSTSVLSLILHNAVNGRSEFIQEKIIKKASFYVPTRNFDEAVKKLKENHFIIISGEPGIGKTTISYLLICDLLANGYQLIYVDDQLKDAEDVLSSSAEVKQVIFFDDFFGANLSEIITPRNSENKIISFIERIQSTKNKFLVMTTRTTILKQAQHNFEKFNRSGLADLSKYELEIKSYSKLDKAKILYNHLFHSGMTSDKYDIFFANKNYLKIIDHKNYFPRLVEFITSVNQLKNIQISETEKFIFDSLNNPKEIWHFAYDHQLNDEERFLLMTLFSLGGYNIISNELEKAFDSRYNYEIRENGFSLKNDAYKQALKTLLDGFIKSEKNSENSLLTFSFLNPSVGDFMVNYLRTRFSEEKRILFSAIYFKQITRYFTPGTVNGLVLTQEQLRSYYPQFEILLPSLISSNNNQIASNITTLFILLKFFRTQVTEKRLFDILSEATIYSSSYINFSQLSHVLNKLSEYASTKKYIKDNWEEFFIASIELAEDSYYVKSVLERMEYYDILEDTWSDNIRFMIALRGKVNEIYSLNMGDLNLYDSQDEIFEFYQNSYYDRALNFVEDKLSEDYAAFIEDCNLSNHFADFLQTMILNGEDLLKSFITDYGVNDEYDPELHGGIDNSFIQNESLEIERLFER